MSDAMTYDQVMRRWEDRGKKLRALKRENAALKRGLRHAHYRVHWHTPDSCSGCEEIEALLTAKETNNG